MFYKIKIIVLFLFFLMFNQAICSSSEISIDTGCKVSGELVEVKYVMTENGGASYEYQVTNEYDFPIRTLSLGDGSSNQILISDEFIPLEIKGPPEWRALAVYKYESEYMSYYWGTKTPSEKRVLDGFLVKLREPQGLMNNLQYRVIFSDGNCVTGTVEALDKPQE